MAAAEITGFVVIVVFVYSSRRHKASRRVHNNINIIRPRSAALVECKKQKKKRIAQY